MSRRRRLLRASWFTAAGDGSWMSREQVRFVAVIVLVSVIVLALFEFPSDIWRLVRRVASLSNPVGRQRHDDSPDVPDRDGYGRHQAEQDLQAWRDTGPRIRVVEPREPKP